MSEQDRSNSSDNKNMRRITLPSGRVIEIMRFVEPDPDIHICQNCNCDCVQPVAWDELPLTDSKTVWDGKESTPIRNWHLVLECPNCFEATEGVYTRQQVEKLEDVLDDHLGDMIGTLQQLTEANMRADISQFIAALQADLILPEDF